VELKKFFILFDKIDENILVFRGFLLSPIDFHCRKFINQGKHKYRMNKRRSIMISSCLLGAFAGGTGAQYSGPGVISST
jgi:hypothetical protein